MPKSKIWVKSRFQSYKKICVIKEKTVSKRNYFATQNYIMQKQKIERKKPANIWIKINLAVYLITVNVSSHSSKSTTVCWERLQVKCVVTYLITVSNKHSCTLNIIGCEAIRDCETFCKFWYAPVQRLKMCIERLHICRHVHATRKGIILGWKLSYPITFSFTFMWVPTVCVRASHPGL